MASLAVPSLLQCTGASLHCPETLCPDDPMSRTQSLLREEWRSRRRRHHGKFRRKDQKVLPGLDFQSSQRSLSILPYRIRSRPCQQLPGSNPTLSPVSWTHLVPPTACCEDCSLYLECSLVYLDEFPELEPQLL